uniref:PiggyBac transposable element-derived protein domain-containing protein n=1 Tax=Acrobeloides nanus TaxID=290746 RepID=A0A914DBD8_9BILA
MNAEEAFRLAQADLEDGEVVGIEIDLVPPNDEDNTDEDDVEEDTGGEFLNMGKWQLRTEARVKRYKRGAHPVNQVEGEFEYVGENEMEVVSGYMLCFEPYQGSSGPIQVNKSLGVGGSVVCFLLNKLSNHKFNVYGDRYFSSIKLARTLNLLGHNYTGTVNSNRVENCPLANQDTSKQPRGYHEAVLDKSNGVAVVSWNDSRLAKVYNFI